MFGLLKRTFKRFQDGGMTDHAASLTYFVMMSLFPALLVGVALLGLLGDQSLVTKAVKYAHDQGAPAEVTNALQASLKSVVNGGGGAGVALVVGIAIALFGASGAFGAAGRALNAVYHVSEDRGFVRHKLSDLAWTIVVILLSLIALVSVFLGGSVASDLFGTIGLGDTAATIWSYARWVVAIATVMMMYALVYSFAPDLEPRRLRWITPGALTGVLIWIVASIGFFFYVSNFGKYGATYGAFAGAVILLLWLYISSIAFLFGAELNAELEHEHGGVRHGSARRATPSSAGDRSLAAGGHEPAPGGQGRVDEKYGRDALAR